MSLLPEFLAIVEHWRAVFFQQRTFQRGVRQALGSLVCLGQPLSEPHHLDQRRPQPQLECGILSALPLPVGAAAVVSTDPRTRFGVLPATLGGRGAG